MTPPNKPTDQETTLPSQSLLKKIEKVTDERLFDLLGISEKLKEEKIAKITADQQQQMREIEEEAIASFRGDLALLEAALGMLRMGHHFGWRVLYLIHSKKTIRNYEEILGHKIRDIFPETGPSSYRSIGLNLAMRFSNFWKVVSGEVKIPKRQESL